MNSDRERQFGEVQFDALLDRALAGYAAEPRAGLENRTLARLRAKEARRRLLGWRWLMSGAVAACLIAAGVVGFDLHRRHQQQELLAKQQSPLAAQQPAYNALPSARSVEISGAPKLAAPLLPRRPTQTVVHVPKVAAPSLAGGIAIPSQFPTPSPLSGQELLLARLAKQADPNIIGTLARSKPSSEIEPLKIEPLRVVPLEPESATQPSSQTGPPSPNPQGEPQ